MPGAHSEHELKETRRGSEVEVSDRSSLVGMWRGMVAYTPPYVVWEAVAEAMGTFFIVIFGVGSVCTAVLTGAQAGIWQVAVVWGFGVTLSILATAEVSGAHLNPAVSLALAIGRPASFAMWKLPIYWFAQYFGAFLGGLMNWAIFGPLLKWYEDEHGIRRGSPESVATAMMFGEYFPNPETPFADADQVVSMAGAFFIEAWGTGILMFMILALTDSRSSILGGKDMAPFFIGFTVSVLISLYAPLTQAGWNPARDFGPRLAAAVAGFGDVAIPGPRNGFWIYILGPKFGTPIALFIYDNTIGRALDRKILHGALKQ